MNKEQKKPPVYGSVVSSNEYENRIKRREWLKKNKTRIIVGAAIFAAAVALILVLLLT